MLCSNAFALPKSQDLVESMGLGYNIGNTMEVPGDPTAWGNTLPTAEYIKGIKAAGFNTVRIPCAWDSHAKNGTIDADWIEQVKDVVDKVIAEGMYAIVNAHWDNGWLEDHVYDGDGYDQSGYKKIKADSIATIQKNYWKQIATAFASYDEHLIFASANEPGVNDPWGPADYYGHCKKDNEGKCNGQWDFDQSRMEVLKKYHEACLKAVRATGGNNKTRSVIVQMPRTEIDFYELLANNYPTDPAGSGYTMAEAHYYPYQYSLMTKDEDWGKQFFYWEGYLSTTDTPHNINSDVGTLGSKLNIVQQFDKLQNAFTSKGIPVVIGEMGALKRLNQVTGENLKLHLQGRAAWYGYVAEVSKARGIVPCIWDTGAEDAGNMTIIRRQKGTVGSIYDIETLNALRKAYGLDTLEGHSIIDSLVKESVNTDNRSVKLTYLNQQDTSSETGTMRINVNPNGEDWSNYDSIGFIINADIKSEGVCTGAKCNEFAWTSLSLFSMSGNWTWKDYNFDEADYNGVGWTQLVVPLNASGLNLADKKKVQAIGLNVYGPQLTGTILIDEVRLYKADGSFKVLESFDKNKPEIEGAVEADLIITPKEAEKVASVKQNSVAFANKLQVTIQRGMISATFTANKTAPATAMLLNSLGQVIAQQSFTANKGVNGIQLNSRAQGPAMLIVKQGSTKYIQKVILK